VRDREFRGGEGEVVRVEDVEIDGARGVSPVDGGAILGLLDRLKTMQEVVNNSRKSDFHGSVQERGRAGWAIDGGGLIDAGEEDWRLGEGANGGDRRAELGGAISEIRPECDADSHGRITSFFLLLLVLLLSFFERERAGARVRGKRIHG
jgi:hypothetical protein